MKLTSSSVLNLVKVKIRSSPGLYKEHYAKVLFLIFAILIGIWAWMFYAYALLPTTQEPEVTIPIVRIPQDLFDQALQDIEAREEKFANPTFEFVRDPFSIPAPPEPMPEEVVE